jgi:MCP family monocarboxylic acid transporter-like MFS transporter 3
MATITATQEQHELSVLGTESRDHLTTFAHADGSRSTSVNHGLDEVPEDAPYSTTAIPDGGYGWVIVASAFIVTFCHNGIINCWGVLQAALLDSSLKGVEP